MMTIFVAMIVAGGSLLGFCLMRLLWYLWNNDRPLAVYLAGVILLLVGFAGYTHLATAPLPPLSYETEAQR